jgi:DNA-binding IclR family transcriptional regulator
VAATIQSIERAAAILRLLSGRERRLGVAQIAGELDLPKGTVHGILRTLTGVGFVEQDPESGKYQLGAALLHMGSSYLDGNELRARALNWSDSLAARSGESVRIGTLHDTKVLVVHHVFRPDDSRQALEVGALLPAHATAMGKVLLASNRYAAAELATKELPGYTSATVTDPHALARELKETLERGWAADVEELVSGVVSIAAPILDRRGATVGAIGISGPVERLAERGAPRTELVSFVREAARAVSRDLGAIPW